LKIVKVIHSFLFLVLMLAGSNLYASDNYVHGKITVLDATTMPHLIMFNTEPRFSGCPGTQWLTWNKYDVENHKTVFAALHAALLTNKAVHVYVTPGTCNAQNIHLTP